MENSNAQGPVNVSKLDAAIAAVEARKAAKAGASPKGASPKAASPNDKTAERLAEQAKLRAQREERKAAKKAEREAARAARTPHMGKVNKAAEKLPPLSDDGAQFMRDITANLSSAEITILAAHLNHYNRVKATEAATHTGELQVGQQVRIMTGDVKFIGQVGTLVKLNRIRCLVDVPGFEREAYLFTSDVIPFVEEDELESVESDSEETPAQDAEVTESPEAGEPEAPEATGTEG